MGNQRSRIAPSQTLQVLDSETRARYKNQREAYQLRLRFEKIQAEHQAALARLTLERYQTKQSLRQLQYEQEEKRCLRNVEQQSCTESGSSTSSSSTSISVETDESEVEECTSSSILLLQNLEETLKWEKLHPTPRKPSIFPPPSNSHENSRMWAEKLNSSSIKNGQSFAEHSKRIQTAIRIAAARTARDARTAERRERRKL